MKLCKPSSFLRIVSFFLTFVLIFAEFSPGILASSGESGDTGTDITTSDTTWSVCQVVTAEEDCENPFVFDVYSDGSELVNVVLTVENSLLLEYVQLEINVFDQENKDPVYTGTTGIGMESVEICGITKDADYRFDMLATEDINTVVYTGYFCVITKDDALSVEFEFAKDTYSIAECGEGLVSQLEIAAELTVVDDEAEVITISEDEAELIALAEELLSSAELAGIRYERESNNTMSRANLVLNDDTTYGKISSSSDVDYYKVQFASSGNANFWLGDIPRGKDYDLYLYNASGTLLRASRGKSSQEQIYNYPVTANTWYYIKIVGYNGSYSLTERYRFRAKNYPASETPDIYETNNSTATATAISSNTTISSATIHNTSDVDYFKFTLPATSNVDISLSNIPAGRDYDVALYTSSSERIAYSAKSSNQREAISARITAGTYYIKVYSYKKASSAKYKLTLSSKSEAIPDNYEPNNAFTTATPISAPNTYYANIHTTTDGDYYSIIVQESILLNIDLRNIPAGCDYDLKLYNASLKQISKSTRGSNNSEVISTTIDPGVYYIYIYSYSGASNTRYTLQVTTDRPLIYDSFSRSIQEPALPPDVAEDLAALESDYNIWPATKLSDYYGWSDTLRNAALLDIWARAEITITGGSLVGYDYSAQYLQNFLDNEGTQMTILVDNLVVDDDAASTGRDAFFNRALAAAEHLAEDGEYTTFCSTRHVSLIPSSGDWYHALGECSTNLKCEVYKDGISYSATVTYYVYDTYNWKHGDRSKGFLPVSQHEMWEMHYGGKAKSFYSYGTYTYTITWTEGERLGTGAEIEE